MFVTFFVDESNMDSAESVISILSKQFGYDDQMRTLLQVLGDQYGHVRL